MALLAELSVALLAELCSPPAGCPLLGFWLRCSLHACLHACSRLLAAPHSPACRLPTTRVPAAAATVVDAARHCLLCHACSRLLWRCCLPALLPPARSPACRLRAIRFPLLLRMPLLAAPAPGCLPAVPSCPWLLATSVVPTGSRHGRREQPAARQWKEAAGRRSSLAQQAPLQARSWPTAGEHQSTGAWLLANVPWLLANLLTNLPCRQSAVSAVSAAEPWLLPAACQFAASARLLPAARQSAVSARAAAVGGAARHCLPCHACTGLLASIVVARPAAHSSEDVNGRWTACIASVQTEVTMVKTACEPIQGAWSCPGPRSMLP